MRIHPALVLAVGLVLLGGCSTGPAAGELPDGKYSGTSQPDSDGTTGEVKFTVSKNRVTEASFIMFDGDGTPHDEYYGQTSSGEISDPEFYQRAQDAIEAEQLYVQQFIQTSNQHQVHKIAGASLSHRLFVQAVEAAVHKAQR